MFNWLSHRMRKSAGGETPMTDIGTALNRLLDFGAIIPPEKSDGFRNLIEIVCRQSYDVYDRVLIMDCIQSALCPRSPETGWRKIVNGIRILDALFDHGSDSIFQEVLEGKHFDILQRMVFLLNYTNTDDRVGRLIRSLAKELKGKLMVKFETMNHTVDTPALENSVSLDLL